VHLTSVLESPPPPSSAINDLPLENEERSGMGHNLVGKSKYDRNFISIPLPNSMANKTKYPRVRLANNWLLWSRAYFLVLHT
jgi:hypothetical protein